VKQSGEIISPRQIAQEALGYDVTDMEAPDLVKGHISKIRNKIAPLYNHNKDKIRNVRNQGYIWME